MLLPESSSFLSNFSLLQITQTGFLPAVLYLTGFRVEVRILSMSVFTSFDFSMLDFSENISTFFSGCDYLKASFLNTACNHKIFIVPVVFFLKAIINMIVWHPKNFSDIKICFFKIIPILQRLTSFVATIM